MKKNKEIHSILSSVKLLTSVSEIVFDNIKDRISTEELYGKLKKGSSKVFLYQFSYFVDNCKVFGYISIPRNCDLKKKNSVVIALRGGNRDFGSIKAGYFFNPDSYFSWFSVDAKYITISTQYRGNSGGTGVDEFGGQDLNDVVALDSIISEISFCNKNDIKAFGWSRGAQVIYQLLKTEDWIKSAVCVAGPTDHVRTIKSNFRSGWKDHLVDMFGGELSEIKKRSAMYWYKEIKKIPILIIHGDADDKVSVLDSIDLNTKLPNSSIVLIKDGNHGLDGFISNIRKLSLKWFMEN
jgi:dipeptidyl aminopeptidase/acylaminoacyl peptidase